MKQKIICISSMALAFASATIGILINQTALFTLLTLAFLLTAFASIIPPRPQ